MKPAGVVVRAKDWQIQSVPDHGEAVRFIRRYHYAHGAGNTSTYRHGMYRADPAYLPLVGELVGVTVWIPPTRAAAETVAGTGWQGVLCLSRIAIAPEIGTNGASFLLGRSMALIDRKRWPVFLTYADKGQGHTGSIYRATNWECLGEVPAGDTWTSPDGRQMGRKRGGKTLRAADMIAAGFTQDENVGKIKFVHRAVSAPPPAIL